ncbi:30S ribosomal protein bS22 [Geodermatophilus sp. SYSU D01105]
MTSRSPRTPRGDDVGSTTMGSVIKKRRKRMAKKKHRKLLKKTRVQRRNKK